MACTHYQWVDIAERDRQISISYGGRLRHIVQGLPNPRDQFPTIVYFYGKRAKVAALQSLFPNNNITRRRAHGIGNIHVDNGTAAATNPLLFVDCKPGAECVNLLGSWTGCHELTQIRADWVQADVPTVVKHLNSELLFLFTDVVCIFVDDVGGKRKAVEVLNDWASSASPRSRDTAVKPHVVLVCQHDAFTESECVSLARSELLCSQYATITTVVTPTGKMSRQAAHNDLQHEVIRAADGVRASRVALRLHFSAEHLAALFELSLANFGQGPMNFVKMARKNVRVRNDFTSHLSTFLHLCRQNAVPDDVVSKFLAAQILREAFPPRMHLFDPRHVFDDVYASSFTRAITTGNGSRVPERSDLVERTATELTRLSDKLHDGTTASRVCRDHVQASARYWKLLKITTLCLFCIHRPPEHVLTCGHAICDECVRDHGTAHAQIHYRYRMRWCHLDAAKAELTVQLKPPNAGPCLLSIDGGGDRGVVALKLLVAVQKCLGTAYPLQDYFDFGAISLLDLFHIRTDVSECLERFDSLARRIFPRRSTTGKSICGRIHELLAWWFADSRYEADVLEQTLKEVFGTHSRLFDTSKLSPSGTKLVVTATTTGDAHLCIFTNYNGVGARRADAGYEHLRPRKPTNEALVWEVARCSSAAPGFFCPKRLAEFGPLQDGGIRANNPIDVILWELAVVWPDATKPDVALSVGTGFVTNNSGQQSRPLRGILSDGFIPRLFRSLMSSPSLDGQNLWFALMNRLSEQDREDYFRLNLPVQEFELRLDDVEHIDALRQSTESYIEVPSVLTQCETIAHALWASSFFFELEERPKFSNGVFTCHGYILCRRPYGQRLVTQIRQTFPSAEFIVNADRVLGRVGVDDTCEHCGHFIKRVSFDMRHLNEAFVIHLVLSKDTSRKISGFPHSLSWFIEQQNLDPFVGRDSTVKSGRCLCKSTSKKRRVSFTNEQPTSKRRNHY